MHAQKNSSRRLTSYRSWFGLRLALLTAVAGLSWLFFINFCHLVYQCGCKSLWAGAAAQCNIYHASGPHCPWCVDGWSGTLVLVCVTASQAALLFSPGGLALSVRVMGSALSLPIVGGVLAVVFGLARGYWSV